MNAKHSTPADADDGAATTSLLLRVGAIVGVVGAAFQIWVSGQHAGHSDPNHSAEVFLEYAASSTWTLVHIGQYVGAVLIVLGLLTLATSLRRERGIAAGFRSVGTVGAIVVMAIFALQMAVDGVQLREAINAWIEAPTEAERTAAFYVAENVRWLEKGISGFFHLTNGMTLTALGLAVAFGHTHPRWIGVLGIASGVTAFAGGISTAHTGFSADAGTFLMPSALAGLAFLATFCVALWRGGNQADRPVARVATT